VTASRTLLQKLVLKYSSLKTLHLGGSEVRHYRNELTGGEQVGKRICMLGLEEAVALREATLLQSITHENLVQVFDVAHVDAESAEEYDSSMKLVELIMPFFRRGSVHDALVRGERFSVAESCLLAQAVLRGLGELHDKHRILHRDMKSPNVFLTEDDSLLKVGDLGVCVPLDEHGVAEPYPSIQIHTPPETFVVDRVGVRYDLFAVGLILLELLNGGFPYDQYFAKDMELRLRRGRSAVLPRDLVPGPQVPPRLRTVIRKSTSAKVDERYSSARVMADAISRVSLVDWRPVGESGDVRSWEGVSAQRRDRRFQVEARRRRNGQWSMSARQYVTTWRKFLPDQIVSDPVGRDATAFFDQVLIEALKP
jgi:serine/threonine protein kinase